MVWGELKSCSDEGILYLVNARGFTKENKQHLIYPTIPSVMRQNQYLCYCTYVPIISTYDDE